LWLHTLGATDLNHKGQSSLYSHSSTSGTGEYVNV